MSNHFIIKVLNHQYSDPNVHKQPFSKNQSFEDPIFIEIDFPKPQK